MLERSCRGSGSISDFFITAQRNPSRSRFRSHRYPSCTIALSLSLAAEQKASPAGAGGPGNPENKKVGVAQPTRFFVGWELSVSKHHRNWRVPAGRSPHSAGSRIAGEVSGWVALVKFGLSNLEA